jgi:peptidyl-prolyl cis-trans isomerase SurA
MAVERLRSRFVQQRVSVTATEIDNLIASGRLRAGEVRLSHILVPVPDAASPEQIARAEQRAREIVAEINGGLDFAIAAIRYSRGPQALEGGDLGWRRIDEVPGVFAEVISQLRVGEVSAPVRGPGGFHIVKLTDQREAGPSLVREFRALHIMVSPNELLSPDQARARIEDIRRRIEAGEDFGDLARQYSDDLGSKNQGGDLGWFEQYAFGTIVGNELGQLADGELSRPFQTEQGSWHLLKRIGTREADRSAERLRQLAEETIRNRKAEEEYAAFVRQIRGEAYIENRLESAGRDTTS